MEKVVGNISTVPYSCVQLNDRRIFKIIPLAYDENGDIEFKVPGLAGSESKYYWKRKTGEFYEVNPFWDKYSDRLSFCYLFAKIHLSEKDEAEWKEVYKGEEETPMHYESNMYWTRIQELVNDAMQKRDRSVSIFISPDGSISVTAYPWPDADELYEQYTKGHITAKDYRAKMGLPMVKDPENFMSKE